MAKTGKQGVVAFHPGGKSPEIKEEAMRVVVGQGCAFRSRFLFNMMLRFPRSGILDSVMVESQSMLCPLSASHAVRLTTREHVSVK